MTAPIIAEELALLERIRDLLEKLPPKEVPSEEPIIRELERLRDQLVGGQENKDAMALHEQFHRQESLLRQLRVSRRAPQIDPQSPYFAHLRLREGGEERDLCLGRATCIERGMRIVDWRNAPVSKIFYRYDQGEEYDEDIAGHHRVGEVLVRRTVAIRDGVLERIESPEGIFTSDTSASDGWEHLDRSTLRLAGGEGSALRAHKAGDAGDRRLGTDLMGARRRVDKRLPEITGLIDPSQFDLITRPGSGYLVIRGAAGSGKTTVALHRIAYLAYDDPEIDSTRSLFVVFSPGLRNYVGHVLPGLGLEQVSIKTYAEWCGHQRKRHFPRLPNEHRIDAPTLVQRLKLHPVIGRALAVQAKEVDGPATVEQAVDDWASVLTRADLLEKTCADFAPGVFSRAEIERFCDWNRRRNEEFFQWMAGDSAAQASLDPEDDALLLRAWQLRVGPLQAGGHKPLRYRHIAIDEVQDFSPIEVQVLLGCLEEGRSITLAGDTQQHLMEDSGFTSWSEFLTYLGVPGAEVETLRISYRSSREIVNFALAVLDDLREDDEPPEAPRSGPPVEIFRFTDRGACVAFLAEALRELAHQEPLASVAVLTPTPELSAAYFEGLDHGDVPRLRRVQQQDFTFAPGVEVTEIEQVKGLEFDYVVVVEVTDDQFPDSAHARRRLHVAATRAVHQLWITNVGTPSKLLSVAH
ncbi:MAG: DNA helicase UvrD [Deltaproteobacteria bacterium]|nr:MAG: DNA helicase UvrD [Deltaproteobacteria bacterium]